MCNLITLEENIVSPKIGERVFQTCASSLLIFLAEIPYGFFCFVSNNKQT